LPKRIYDVTISADEPFLGKNQIMKKNVLIVYAHPEPASLTRQLVELSVQTLQEQ